MYLRQSSDVAPEPVYLTDGNGVPTVGAAATSTVTAYRTSDGASVTAPTLQEVGSGLYRLVLAGPLTADICGVVVPPSGSAQAVPFTLLVGRYTDLVDAATSTRATHAEATGDTAGTSTLLGRLTSGRASLLDALSLLDAAVSTRATHAEATTDTAGTATLLGRLSSARAALLDLLANVDATVSSRARPSDLNVTVTSQPNYGEGRLG